MGDLKFDVRYMDESHKALLDQLPIASKISDGVANGVAVPSQEVLVYTVFREQKLHLPGWGTFQDLKRKLPNRLPVFHEYFDFSDQRIRSQFPRGRHADNTQTESAGVGVALAIVSHFYGLIEADWEKIPIAQSSDLDFQIAVSQHGFVEVEAKGTITDSREINAVRTPKSSIAKKKHFQRTEFRNTSTLIGAITAFPVATGERPLVWLMDPPKDAPTIEPDRFKLLARLHLFWRELKIITRSHFLSALATRISSLGFVKDFYSLDNKPLLGIDGQPFETQLMTSRSTVGLHEYAFGEVIHVGEGKLFFYGMRNEVVDVLLRQSHFEITQFRKANISGVRQIKGRIREVELKEAGVALKDFKKLGTTRRYEVPLKGNMFETTAG